MENDKKVDIPTKIRHYFLFSKSATKGVIFPTKVGNGYRRSLSCFPYHVSNAETPTFSTITMVPMAIGHLTAKTCSLRLCSAASFSLGTLHQRHREMVPRCHC